jgi:hypothetical protein
MTQSFHNQLHKRTKVYTLKYKLPHKRIYSNLLHKDKYETKDGYDVIASSLSC